jgi:hypothetical protein
MNKPKLFISGPRHIVSDFVIRHIEKGYNIIAVKDDENNASATLEAENGAK